jgi:hypothetical protein
MRKAMKKLKLKTETIRNLQDGVLFNAVGGVMGDSFIRTNCCPPTKDDVCATL